MFKRILLDPQGGEGGGTTTTDSKDPVNVAASVVAKHGGDPTKAVLALVKENYKFRERARVAEGKVPAEGAVVLTGDEAKAWETYRTLGKPEDFQSALTERDTLKAESAGRAKADFHQQVAGETFNVDVLSTLLDRDNLTPEMRDEKAGGKDVKVPYVKDEKGKDVKLLDYAKKRWEPFLPSLLREKVRGTGPATPSPGLGGPPRPTNNPAPPGQARIYRRNPF